MLTDMSNAIRNTRSFWLLSSMWHSIYVSL